jgi:hypothetical protein
MYSNKRMTAAIRMVWNTNAAMNFDRRPSPDVSLADGATIERAQV